jgi:hypothetical protein
MSQDNTWIQKTISHFQNLGVHAVYLKNDCYRLNNLVIQFASANTNMIWNKDAAVILHEDIYQTREQQVIKRLNSLLGLNVKKIHGRNTRVELINKEMARNFVDENHLMGYCNGKVHLGLFYKNELVAVGVFSGIRQMKYENPPYSSGELERFCSLADYAVAGGLDKVVKYYLKNYPADDLITTTDADWSNGGVYSILGFERLGISAPVRFAVNQNTFVRRVLTDTDALSDYEYEVKNLGNIKFRIINRFRLSLINPLLREGDLKDLNSI